jgi:hypothetical protein
MRDVTQASSPGESSTRSRSCAGTQAATLLAAATLGVFKPGRRATSESQREAESRKQVRADEAGDLGDLAVLDPEHVNRESPVRRFLPASWSVSPGLGQEVGQDPDRGGTGRHVLGCASREGPEQPLEFVLDVAKLVGC